MTVGKLLLIKMASNINIIHLTEKDIPGAELKKLPEDSSVLELQRWLECHGEKKSGRKEELVKRVQGCIQIKKGVDPKVDGGKWYTIKENEIPTTTDILLQGSLDIIQQEVINQPESTSKKWKNFPSTNIPPSLFNEGHIYQYLVDQVKSINLVGDPDAESEDDDDVGTAKPLKKGRALLSVRVTAAL